ncbi:MAG: hypothetical protein H6635_15760 [Anaerolineales bacterium]|nr:hypothetical protein [Anaerolineales bacterium]MCB9146817.1 hypothetical protein [Anaerolineales bacterium]
MKRIVHRLSSRQNSLDGVLERPCLLPAPSSAQDSRRLERTAENSFFAVQLFNFSHG